MTEPKTELIEETQPHYQIYLAVPGVNFVWGTVTGVINCTLKHTVHPRNTGAAGYACNVDFNTCWTEALNWYKQGRITHFAMLHGDITPATEQHWLDELVDIMEEKQAALVSAIVPIKDHRGVTSTGICDPQDPWGAFRRFTMREVIEELPETFDHRLAGYPDRPLLHNTGMWVCDLRKPVFHVRNEDGSYKFIFNFPERIREDKDGTLIRQQESEDWFFSRMLWECGERNTWATRRVKLNHHGGMVWPNNETFGHYDQGDRDTIQRWQPEADELPLAVTQILEFELGSGCNLGPIHPECPNMAPDRYGSLDTSRILDDATIVNTAVRAYRELGFNGMVGWIYYNEPLLQKDRMFRLMGEIKQQVPKAKFILWTNGYLIEEDCERYDQFTQIVISGYDEKSQRGLERLKAKITKPEVRYFENATLDNRMVQIQPVNKAAPCFRPFVEFIIDNHGNVHLCCYDYQGKATPGNIFKEDIATIAKRWRDGLQHIGGDWMTAAAPDFCQDCGHRWSEKHQLHDLKVLEAVERVRSSWRPKGVTA